MRFWRRSQKDVDGEIESHLAFQVERMMLTGMSAAAAREPARRAFGNVTRSARQSREFYSGSARETGAPTPRATGSPAYS